jgi:SET domain-containing protein
MTEVVTRALRDIDVGEELTDDYSSFEDDHDCDNLLSWLIDRLRLVDEEDPRDKHREDWKGGTVRRAPR